jgi:NADH:ubiquinone oxidoreductase subunit K
MSLVNFERFFDRVAPAILLVLGLTVAAATAVVGA